MMRLRKLLLELFLTLTLVICIAADDTGLVLCTEPKRIDHHQVDELGEYIFLERSDSCTGDYYFYVDESIRTVTVYVEGGINSATNVYKDDVLVEPHGTAPDVSGNIRATQYDEISSINGYGKYKIVVTSAGAVQCTVFVRSVTMLRVDGGFVQDVTDDTVQYVVPQPNQGVSRSPVIGKTSYFAFEYPMALFYPAKPLSVTFIKPDNTKVDSPLQDRYNCEASLISGPFDCGQDLREIYHLKVVGIDRRGNTWERVYPFYCETTSVPTTPPPEPPPTECYNEGELVNFGQENQQCYCKKNYEGKWCETLRCFNGGVLGKYSRCTCQSGFGGESCEHVLCESKTEGYDDPESRAIVFIIRRGRSMVKHIEEIRKAAEQIAATYSNQHPNYIQRWVLITIFNGDIETYSSTHSADFIQAIGELENEQDTICSDTIFTAISAAIDNPAVQMYKRSVLFVFSDGMPNDDANERLRLLHQLSFFRGQIFFMLADSPDKRCVIDTTTDEYRSLRYLAQFSFGQVAYVKLEELAMSTTVLASSSYKADHVYSNDFMDSCKRAPKYQTFFVDRSLQKLYITATGKDLKLYLTNPAHERTEPVPSYSASSRLYMWNIDNIVYGGYLAELESGSYEPCSFRVFGEGGTSLWMGVSHDINDDATVRQPVYKEASHMVARINNVNYQNPESIIAEATIWTNEGRNDKRTVMYASGGIYRDNCNFNLYFGYWQCLYPNELFYVNVYVSTEENGVIQRSYALFCSTTPPTEKPPNDCQNGGIENEMTNGTKVCLCPAHYTGDKCQTIQCLNMGVSLGSVCECISGFSGEFCEKAACYERNTRDTFSPNGRSLTFIIQDAISTRSAINSIQREMPVLIQDLTHQQKDWISNYQLWRFNDSSFTPLSSSPDPNVFMDSIKALLTSNRQASDFSCSDLTVTKGLLRVLMNSELTLNGIVYLFINGYMEVDTSKMEVEATYQLLGLTRIMFNVVLMSGSPCGHDMSETETTTLMNFVGYTGGQFIMVMPPKAGNVIHSIPTLYRTNYVYDSVLDDCTTTQNFYFPIDSQTQSFTAYLVGDFDDDVIKYYKPDGTQIQPYNIWKDYGMGSQMDQIIQECDNEWTLLNNRCWRFSVIKMNWTEAQASCRASNAVLISLFNQQEQQFVDGLAHGYEYWTGLNNLVNENEYVWDTIDDKPLKLESTGYSNFGPGQPTNDPFKRCVYDKGGFGWSNDNCATERNFICVKHAYNAEYEPDAGNLQDLLARGIWKLSLKTISGGCSVQIYAQSGIGLYTKYVTDQHMDDGSEQPYTNANNNRFIGHVTNQVTTTQGLSGSLQYAHLYKNSGNMSIVEAQTFFPRDSDKCAYEYISTSFKCPETNFLALITGIDRFGYLYQRIQPVDCFNGPVPEDCENGVYSNGRCLCDPKYQGDFCQTPICERGKLNEMGEKCLCPDDYTGTFCEIPICTEGGTKDIPSVFNRTFVLLLDGSQNGRMEKVANNLKNVLKMVLDTSKGFPDWFSHYTGVVFRDDSMGDQVVSDIIESDDSDSFIAAITKEAAVEYKPTIEARSTIAALNRVLESQYIVPRSYIWIVTGGNTLQPEKLPTALDAVARLHSYVNFLIIDDTKSPGGVAANDPSLLAYYDLVIQTSGQYYQVESDEYNYLVKFWTTVLGAYYDTYFVTTVNSQECSKGLTEYVQLASEAKTMIIDYTGAGQVELYKPDGTKMSLTKACSSSTNKVYEVSLMTSEPGLWKVNVLPFQSPTKFCRMEVRGHSAVEVFVGYVHDIGDSALHSGSVDYRPLTDEPNSVVANTNVGRINFAQIFSADERKLLWSSPMIRRDNCTYQYISANHFICMEPSLSVAIDGEDDKGYAFRRMIHTHCVGNFRTTVAPPTRPPTTTTAPPPTLKPVTCDPNGKFDIIVMFDASYGFTQHEFEDIVQQYYAIVNSVTIDSDHIRLAAGYYSTVAEFIPGFSETADDFNTALEVIQKFGHMGDVGNNIYGIFAAMDTLTFRDDADKVLLLFSSLPLNDTDGSLPSFEDPQELAKEFRDKGGRIIAAGYGKKADADLLNAISAGCSKMSTTLGELEAFVQWTTNAICRLVWCF